ncbi:hypothetical protein BDD12DRAFT_807571 [Trichophaea hybrida]|nr:hypothetical protein BDD12DRAFT_807571 [Trichophaea hybrida]
MAVGGPGVRNERANHDVLAGTQTQQTQQTQNHHLPLPSLLPIGHYAQECMEETFRDSPSPSASIGNNGILNIPHTIFFDGVRKGVYTAEFEGWEDLHLSRFLKGPLPMKYFGQGSIVGFIPKDAREEMIRMFYSALEFEQAVCHSHSSAG